MPCGVGFGDELQYAQAEHEQDEDDRLKVVDQGRILERPELAGAMQRGDHHHEDAGGDAPKFEADQPALLDQAIEFHQADAREHDHERGEDVIRDDFIAGEHGHQHDRPQDRGAGKSARKNFRLRNRRWCRYRCGHGREN
jgi:hypothetical protein